MTTSEQMALDLARDSQQLRRRLLDTKSVLVDAIRAKFTYNRFDIANRRLLSDDGTLCLQWQLRECPDLPESYDNQQTNIGTVILRRLS